MVKSAKFEWGDGELPYYQEITRTPINSIIGGAASGR